MILTHEQVLERLPHRPPMLLIDEASSLSSTQIVASLRIRDDWEIFRGHFPAAPMLPGVYTIEAMAQASDLILLSDPVHAGKLPIFASVEQARFLRPIRPGDEIRIESSLQEFNPSSQMATVTCSVYLGDKKAATASLTIALR